jgi:regulator of sigma E protease
MEWILSVLSVVAEVFAVVLIFNTMIVVHELGHFLAALWRGLKVEKFYVWFGKPLWKKEIGGVEFGLGCIPAGGFVALPQMAPMEALEGERKEGEAALPPITPLDKIIVAVAGPLFSFGLAVLFAVIVVFIGRPVSTADMDSTIGFVHPTMPAAQAGMLPGDRVLSVDGHPVTRFSGQVDSVMWGVVSSEGEKIKFEIERPGAGVKVIEVVGEKMDVMKDKPWWQKILSRAPLKKVGIGPVDRMLVEGVQQHSPAHEAGLMKDDEILELNRVRVYSITQYYNLIQDLKDSPAELKILRSGKEQLVSITPRMPDVRPEDWEKQGEDHYLFRDGLIFSESANKTLIYPAVWLQVKDAARGIYNMLSKLVSPKSDIKVSQMGGAVAIGRAYYLLMDHPYAWSYIFWFSVVLNINLAMMNMLPLPVLDGGHITMAIGEWVRGKPLSGKFLEWMQAGCAYLLMALMVYTLLKDVGDIVNKPKNQEIKLDWKAKSQ